MCGIATISIGRSARNRIPYDKMRSLVRELMVEIQARGLDASGIAVINEPGTEHSVVYKKPLRADRLIVRPMFKDALSKIGPNTNFILMHARATTVGSTEENYNNHPIVTPNIVGIHNGTLYNQDRLFAKFSDEFPREGEVDSEIIFRLYNHFIEQEMTEREALRRTSDLLIGAFTGAIVDWRKPRQMVMFKYDRSLCIVHIPYYDVSIAISEANFFHSASKRLGLKVKTDCFYVRDGAGFIFNLDRPGTLSSSLEVFEIPVPRTLSRFSHSPWLSGFMG